MHQRPADKSKRKNDDKRKKHHLRRAQLIAVIGICLVIGGFLTYTLNRPRFNPDMPFAPLVYVATTGKRYALNFQTGERSITTSVGDLSSPAPILPNGQWRIAAWAISDPQSYEPNLAMALQNTKNPDIYLDTGRLSIVGSESWSSDSQWLVFSSPAANCLPESKAGLSTSLPATPRPRIEYCIPGHSNALYYTWSDLWLFHIPTGDVFPITDNKISVDYAVFSPRQSQIAYTQRGNLYLFDVNTRELRLLFSDDLVYEPHWSPDGQWIAIKSAKWDTVRRSRELYIVRPDGTGLQRVAVNVLPTQPVHWIP